MSDIQAMRGQYRNAKARLLRSAANSGPSTRGVRRALQQLSALADTSLRLLYTEAGFDGSFALLAVGRSKSVV